MIEVILVLLGLPDDESAPPATPVRKVGVRGRLVSRGYNLWRSWTRQGECILRQLLARSKILASHYSQVVLCTT